MKDRMDCKYWELRKAAHEATTLQELRKIHKELKPYGDGILFFDRYPKARVPIIVLVKVSILIASILIAVFIGSSIGIAVVRLLSCIR